MIGRIRLAFKGGARAIPSDSSLIERARLAARCGGGENLAAMRGEIGGGSSFGGEGGEAKGLGATIVAFGFPVAGDAGNALENFNAQDRGRAAAGFDDPQAVVFVGNRGNNREIPAGV